LSGMRSAPTTDRATWCPTPAARSAARRLRVEVSKNAITAASSHDGAFVTSMTTFAPASAWASPSPVRLLTPDDGDAATTSWPCRRRMVTSFFPMSPVPPMTTIFMTNLLGCRPQVAGGWEGEIYSTSATDQRASLSGLLVMYTARPPPAMHRATTWMALPPDLNITPGAVHRDRVHLEGAVLLAEHPGQEPGGPVPPADHDPRRAHLAPA